MRMRAYARISGMRCECSHMRAFPRMRCDAMRCECAHAMRCECAHQGGTYACPVLLYNVFHGLKKIPMLENKTRRFNYKSKICQNAALPLNGMHLNIPSTECWTLCRAASSSCTAWVGNAYARPLAPWAILSISDNDDTTSPRQTF